MSEIFKNLRASDEAAGGFEHAYRVATVDTYCELGMLKEAVRWLWDDITEFQRGEF